MNTSAKLPEHKQTQAIQSWHDPALKTLSDFLEIRKANLKSIVMKRMPL
jgi:hypothetical protein